MPLINADERGFLHSELTDGILRVFYDTYNELGYGFLEAVYERAMCMALNSQGFKATSQVSIPVWFHGEQIGDYKADIVVNNAVVLELKAARTIEPAHQAQLLNYLRATSFVIGLLLNFGPRPEIRRLAFSNARKRPGATAAIGGQP